MRIEDNAVAATQLSHLRTDRPRDDKDQAARAGDPDPVQSNRLHTTAVTIPPADHIFRNTLENANDAARTVVREIRRVDQTMQIIGQTVDHMQAVLGEVLKQYPPYSVDDQDRIGYLRQFSALRKVIEELTFPPPDDGPQQILGDPAQSARAGDWQPTSDADHMQLKLHHQPVHPDSGGLAIADLVPDAPDDAVARVHAGLDDARRTIHDRHQAFVTDANRLVSAMAGRHET